MLRTVRKMAAGEGAPAGAGADSTEVGSPSRASGAAAEDLRSLQLRGSWSSAGGPGSLAVL